ncbi:MAG: HAMP domain-containing protein [Betaproteobacteria bacterium]|nr:MAG: HAMP domain-containing protein [Betaproteobacteria bacterium]
MRLIPASLFGRTLLILAAGLFLAQAASVAMNLLDRGSSVYRLAAYQIAARIAQTARILDRLPPEERRLVVEELDGRHLRVALSREAVSVAGGYEEHDRYEKAFAESLQRQLGAPWPVNVDIAPLPRSRRAPGDGTVATPFEVWVARHFYFLLPGAFSLVAQVRLEDGSFAVFYAAIPQEPLSRLESLVPRLLLLVVICFALAAALVRMTTRSLGELARAADTLGENLEGPPLAERDPSEIRRVIAAYNRMLARVRAQLAERAWLLGAISHDLQTPITRMRLRCETLSDAHARAKMERDLNEMAAMVGSTLEFFRALGSETRRRPVDVRALVETVCEDRRESGESVTLNGAPHARYHADPQSLRRCIENLVGNAVRYGGAAEIGIEDDAKQLRISVRDCGPGIPEEQLERVFEPYYRVEASRNRASGGTGLGLSIARNIARWHGGDIRLCNAPGGGLIAELTLPR